MGATVWQRDGNGGKTFSTGVQSNPQRPSKRKLVWKRDDQQLQAQQSEAPPPRSTALPAQPSPLRAAVNGAKRHKVPPAPFHQPVQHQAAKDSEDWDGEVIFDVPESERGNSSGSWGGTRPSAQAQSSGLRSGQAKTAEQAEAELKLRRAQQELEALKRSIADREQRVAREQRDAAAREASERWQREDMARRKSRLEAGFSEAFKLAKETAAADIAKAKSAPVNVADAAEVARVLEARDDYEVMRVQPGASAGTVRRRYREMAVALHPDKCQVSKATDAFQRLVRAYQEVVRMVA